MPPKNPPGSVWLAQPGDGGVTEYVNEDTGQITTTKPKGTIVQPGGTIPDTGTHAPTSTAPDAPAAKPKTSAANAVVALAAKYVGTPYTWGGETPDGFDCSGFAQWLYAQQGIELPRVTYDQWKVGTFVRKGALLPGDLLFFRPGPQGPEHEGIYIGNGQFIHASGSRGELKGDKGGKVKISKLSDPYYSSKFMGARRVAPGGSTVLTQTVEETSDPAGAPAAPSTGDPAAPAAPTNGDQPTFYTPSVPGGPSAPAAGLALPGSVERVLEPRVFQETWRLLAADPYADQRVQSLAAGVTANA